MINDVHVAAGRTDQVLKKIIADEVLIVGTPHAMILSRKNHHVEPFVLINKRIGEAERRDPWHVVIHIAGDKHELTFQVPGKFHVGWYAATLCQAVERLAPPLDILIVVMVAGGGDGYFIKVGVSEDSGCGHESAARMSIDTHTAKIHERILGGEALKGMLVIGERIIAQVTVAEAVEVVPTEW